MARVGGNKCWAPSIRHGGAASHNFPDAFNRCSVVALEQRLAPHADETSTRLALADEIWQPVPALRTAVGTISHEKPLMGTSVGFSEMLDLPLYSGLNVGMLRVQVLSAWVVDTFGVAPFKNDVHLCGELTATPGLPQLPANVAELGATDARYMKKN